MPARKRIQGQQRRLRKYLRDQTGSDDLAALHLRCDDLRDAIAKVDRDLDQLAEREQRLPLTRPTGALTGDAIGRKVDEAADAIGDADRSNRELIHEARSTQRVRLADMRKEMVELLAINTRMCSRAPVPREPTSAELAAINADTDVV